MTSPDNNCQDKKIKKNKEKYIKKQTLNNFYLFNKVILDEDELFRFNTLNFRAKAHL